MDLRLSLKCDNRPGLGNWRAGHGWQFSGKSTLRNRHHRRMNSPSDTPLRVVLYTRAGCHLCDDARQLLEAQGLTPELVYVDADPTLRERFDTCVPVVEIDDKIRFRGHVNPVLLRRLLERPR
jgi:glutaredoxin